MPTIDLTDNELAEVIDAVRRAIRRQVSDGAAVGPVESDIGETHQRTRQAGAARATAACAHREADEGQARIAEPLGPLGNGRGFSHIGDGATKKGPRKKSARVLKRAKGRARRLFYARDARPVPSGGRPFLLPTLV
jgi:hypothetical protein